MSNNTNDPGAQLVVVAEYSSDAAAHIAAGVLRTNGIECVINNEIIAGVFAIPTADFDAIRLVVHRRDLATAQRLLGLGQADDIEQ